MPIYECRCASCNQKTSLSGQSTSAQVDAVSPLCESAQVDAVSPHCGGAQVEAVCPQYGTDDLRRGKTPEGLDILHPES